MTDLTIIMPCWNKEAYISEALDSVFAQKTSFSYEIVIADDHSTDRTLAIVSDYERCHPGVITVLRSDENLKLFRNVRRAYAVCKTPYFCVLDPDDCWTDEQHLEKALSFLAAHPDYTIYSAGIEQLFPDGTHKSCGFPTKVVDSDFGDFLRQRAAIAFTQTCVYRNVVFANGLPSLVANPSSPSMERSLRGDSFRNFLHIREGKAHFSPETEARYRITDEGVYQGMDELGRLLLNARLYADFWEYDGRAHIELLALSRRFAAGVRKNAFEVLASSSVTDEKRRTVLAEIAALERLYGDHDAALDACVRKGLSFRKQLCYWAYLRLKARGVV